MATPLQQRSLGRRYILTGLMTLSRWVGAGLQTLQITLRSNFGPSQRVLACQLPNRPPGLQVHLDNVTHSSRRKVESATEMPSMRAQAFPSALTASALWNIRTLTCRRC